MVIYDFTLNIECHSNTFKKRKKAKRAAESAAQAETVSGAFPAPSEPMEQEVANGDVEV